MTWGQAFIEFGDLGSNVDEITICEQLFMTFDDVGSTVDQI